MRDNKLSRRLSTSKQRLKRLDDDSNDLIKTTSNTLFLGRAASVSSSSTIVHDSDHEPVLPIESPTQRKPLGPADLNLQSMFDNGQALDRYNSRAAKTLSMPEYPVYKLDTTRSPRKTLNKKLQAPLGAVNERGNKRRTWDAELEKKDVTAETGTGLKTGWSMTGLFRKSCSLRMSRSVKGSRTAASRSNDDSSVAEVNRVHETAHRKWLEANGLMGRGRGYGWANSIHVKSSGS